MQEFDLSKVVLDDILDNDTPFNEALRKIFQTDPSLRPQRSLVAALVGCELRHHLLFGSLVNRYEDFEESEKRYLRLALGDLCFVKRISREEMVEILKNKLSEEKMATISPLLEQTLHPETLIPTDLNKASNKYLSLRYNTPEWVLKIWEHFGFGTTYKILKKFNRHGPDIVRIRTSKLNEEEFLNQNPDFVKTKIDGLLYYGGKNPLRKIKAFQEGNLFLEKPATKALLDRYIVNAPKEVFLYNGNPSSSLIKEILETYQNKIGINIGVPSLDNYLDVTSMIKREGLKNVNFFASSPSSLEASISNPQDLVIAAPNSSNFDSIPSQPDYLLHFKKDGMDALFAQEKEVLEGASAFTENGGTLIYLVYTISKKEGHHTIDNFLANHKEFELVEEKQCFPFDEHETAFYYAVMHKTNKEKTIATPIDTSFLKKEEESSLSLEQK